MSLKTRSLVLDGAGRGRDTQGGTVLIVQSISAGPSIDIQWILADGLQGGGFIGGAVVGQKFRPGFAFLGVQITGTAGATIGLLIGSGDADADLQVISVNVDSNEVTIANPDPIPVEWVATPPPGLADTVHNVAPVVAGAAATALLAADDTRRVFYARNIGPDPVALGAAGMTFADAAIVLLMDETWKETLAPGAAWFCIRDAGTAATVKVTRGTTADPDDAIAGALADDTLAATDAIALVLAADPARRGFYVLNTGPDEVALVGAAGTFANAGIVLQPGDLWREESAPSAAWYGICDAGETADLKILEATT